MPTYIVLMNWTEQGVRTAKETVKRYEDARAQIEQAGIQIRDVFWTSGAYDVVTIADAADDETVAAWLLTLAGAGNIRSTTMRAFSADEMLGVVGRMG